MSNPMTTTTSQYDFDFAVAGGGPAGSSAAISLGQRGHSVVLFERETFPRFHIGESLLSTANDAFTALGLTKQIEAACFPNKWGARLFTHDGQSGRYVAFTDVREVTKPQTYQVCREEFDRILLDRARDVGVDVREGWNVGACEFAADAAILDVASRSDAATTRVRVRALVDATGRVGVVLPLRLYRRLAKDLPEETLNSAIADTPLIAELMRDARREWPVRVEKDFSYSASAYAGDRWILAGDAGFFLDPVFSTGVSVAMESGIEAAAELHRALMRNDFSASTFAAFSRRHRKRFKTFRRFVVGFYTPQFRDIFFSPEPPRLIFRSVVTILAGRWNASLWTRFLNQLFFGVVAIQKHFNTTQRGFRRDRDAGYPDETRSAKTCDRMNGPALASARRPGSS